MNFLDSVMAVLVAISSNPIDKLEQDIQIEADPQIVCLAQNIYHEARNESTAGKIAVANVVMNRKNSDAFPNTVCEVVYEGPHYTNAQGNMIPYKHRCQFSWYCDGKSDKILNQKKYDELYILANFVYKNNVDLTDGALFYHADYVEPEWSKRLKVTAKIDTHIFYRQ